MMWRVLAAMDFVTTPELHWGVAAPAVGVSLGFHFAIGAWAWKFDRQCLLGPIPANTPPVLGHDAGILRPHILIDPTPLPPPPACSVLTSTLATACSALKPCFSASRDLRNGGGPLPVCTEVLPYGLGLILSGNVPCGFAGPHRGIPMIPTQLQDWSGLTVGDIVGGMANMAAEWMFQAALESTAIGLGKINRLGGTLAKTVGGEILNNTFAFIFGYVAPFTTPDSMNNLGHNYITQPIQQAVDGLLSDQGLNPNAPSDFNPSLTPDTDGGPQASPFSPFSPVMP